MISPFRTFRPRIAGSLVLTVALGLAAYIHAVSQKLRFSGVAHLS